MAVLTRHCGVPPGERVPSRCVIEAPVIPAFFGVTVQTLGTNAAAVHVVVAVAIYARSGRFTMWVALRMAGLTGRARVCRGQRKIRKAVIEYTGSAQGNIRVAALVVGMAGYAFVVSRGREQPVKPFTRLEIGRKLCMAVQTECLLRLVRGSAVTLGAIALDVGMALNEPARHYQFLDSDGERGLAPAKQCQGYDEYVGGLSPHLNSIYDRLKLRRVEMHGYHVHAGSHYEQHEERKVYFVPKREKTLVGRECSDSFHAAHMFANIPFARFLKSGAMRTYNH